jgi:hypothetical protein
MGRGTNYKKLIKQWLADLPESKLKGGIPDDDNVCKDREMRLDCQRVVTMDDGNKYFNLQVQVNNSWTHTTLAKLARNSVASCLAPVQNPWSARQIREALLESVTGSVLDRPRRQ